MNRNMPDVYVSEPANGSIFMLGLVAGTVVGAGLVMWLAPRAAAEARRTVTDSANAFRESVTDTANALRESVTDTANAFRESATDQYGQASRRVVAAADDLATKGFKIRDDAANAVLRGAHEVERVAVAVKAVPASRKT
jgi:gas vesicle protein